LSGQQIRQLTGFATVEAVLKPDGTFLRAQLIESSGSDAFDSVLHTSASKGAVDPNPPAGAAAKDGNIHFIFKARSWSQVGVSRRSGAPIEQRWLLLATGLE
jgi:TonB family protein